MELQEEDLVQLSLLAQSPGWALYKARLQRLNRSLEGLKADALRGLGKENAIYLQGKLDGLRLALEELDRWSASLQRGETHLPSGSGQEE